MEPIRLVTVHPALVHFAIGTVPVILLGYAVGARWKSRSWTLVGDVALVVTAALSLVAAAFGLVSFLVVDWPGGLTLWKWLHLGLGAGAAALLGALAVYRLRVRGRQHNNGGGTFVLAGITSIAILAAGWVGGEVLVFHSGIAVRAAADGALAPPVIPADDRAPKDLKHAMGLLRSHWAATQVAVAEMVVSKPPSDAQFDLIAREARAMSALAAWIAAIDEHDGNHEHPHDGTPVTLIPPAAADTLSTTGSNEGNPESDLAAMGAMLEQQVAGVAEQARARNLVKLSREVGRLNGLCAGCHQQHRWQRGPAKRPAGAGPAVGVSGIAN